MNDLAYEPYPQITPADRIIYVNATSNKKLFCPRAYQFHNVRGFKPVVEDPVLTVGKAIHKYAEQFTRTNGKHVQALTIASGSYPSVEEKAMVKWCAGRQNITLLPPIIVDTPTGPRAAIEYFFRVPWRRYDVNGVSYVLVLCGTLDLLSSSGSSVTVYDYKSSRGWQLDEIAAGYANDAQFHFYLWNLWKHGHYFLPLNYHNIIREWKFSLQVVVAQVGSNRDPKWQKCPPILMNEDDMAEFEELMDAAARQILALHVLPDDEVAEPRGKVIGGCKFCDFAKLCFAKTTLDVTIAAKTFVQKPYNPEHHDE
jgi:hypothetical protein